MRKALLNFFALTCLCLITGCFFSESKSPSLSLGTVERTHLEQRVTVAGTVVPKRRTVFVPPYTGYIKKMYVKVGDQVKKGDPVVSLVQSLHASNEEIFPIRAPFPGTVVQVLNAEGEYVQQNDPKKFMVRIDDLSQLFVETEVPEIDVPKLKIGQSVIIKASAILGQSYHGVVRKMALAANESERWQKQVQFSVRMAVLDPDPHLQPGMSVVVDVITAKRDNVLTLRHEYIRKKDNGYFVLDEEGALQKIEVGLQNEERFEITAGLTEGQRVRQTDFLSLLENEKEG